MHEFHFIEDLFNDLMVYAKKHKAGKVTKVFLEMGEFSEINEEIVRFFFAKRSKGTMLQEAELYIDKKPGRKLELVSFNCE